MWLRRILRVRHDGDGRLRRPFVAGVGIGHVAAVAGVAAAEGELLV
jgi:hypothetical protein